MWLWLMRTIRFCFQRWLEFSRKIKKMHEFGGSSKKCMIACCTSCIFLTMHFFHIHSFVYRQNSSQTHILVMLNNTEPPVVLEIGTVVTGHLEYSVKVALHSLQQGKSCKLLTTWAGHKGGGGNRRRYVCDNYDENKMSNCPYSIMFSQSQAVQDKGKNVFKVSAQYYHPTHDIGSCTGSATLSVKTTKKILLSSSTDIFNDSTKSMTTQTLQAALSTRSEPISLKGKNKTTQQNNLYRLRRECEAVTGAKKPNFGSLRSWLARFLELNPGSVARFETVADSLNRCSRFNRAFLMPGAIANIFKKSQVRFAATDAGFIHNKHYRGHCFVLESFDGAGKCYPVAVALASGETIENWEWFLEQICRDEEIRDILNNALSVLMSDRHDSIKAAVKKMFPLIWHRKCFLHIIRNLQNNKIRVTAQLRAHLWATQGSSTEAEYDQNMLTLLAMDPAAHAYLSDSSKLQPSEWVMFPLYEKGVSVYGRTTSNDVEQEMHRCVKIQLIKHYSRN